MEISAIIVARKGSERIKNKSMLKLDGETLIARKIRQLQQCKLINRVILGSDSEEMLEEARNAGAEAIKRPEYYCNEITASANQMIKNMCSLIQTDIVVWAHCTNPLLSSQTYDKAIETYLNNLPDYDSLLSVTKLQEHLWQDSKPLNYNPWGERHIPARELKPLYMQDGGIFIQSHQNMSKNSYFFGEKPYLFEIPSDEFLDINNYRDYIIAQSIINDRKITQKI